MVRIVRIFSGSLFRQMDEVYDYIDFRNQTHSTFQKLRRIVQRDYPETAVREALFNLLVNIPSAPALLSAFMKIGWNLLLLAIILPNLNVHTGQEKPAADKPAGGIQEGFVIVPAKKQVAFTRKDLEKTLEISQTACGRLLRRMIENGQIVQEGKGRNTHYRLSE